LQVLPFSHYTVQAGDFGLAGHNLRDDAALGWHDLCDHPSGNCNPNPPDSAAASLSLITKLTSSTATAIHNASHQTVMAVGVGTTVHDFVTVTGQGGQPAPSGNVNIDWFLNGDCSGAPAANSGNVGPLVPASGSTSTFDATAFNFTVNSPGFFAFKAHYLGDAIYTASDGPCEPLRVVDANIQITPANATNPVGTNHVLTITVNALGGTIDAGSHTATASIVSGPGSFVGSPSCTYTGGAATASCTVTITSAAVGTTVVQATSDIPVNGMTITRTTGTAVNTAGGGSDNANKNWADDNVRTDVHDTAHTVITTANAGDVVHDKVFVERAVGTPAVVPDPTGTVTFNLYAGLTCSGNATAETVPLGPGGTAESSATTVAADLSYQAVYSGDANYPTHTGACEPLQVKTALPCPAGSFTFNLNANGDLVITYDQFPAPNDNSYGVNAVGWGGPGKHTFGNLVGSDHAGFSLIDPNGVTKLDFNIDYISQFAGTPSGYKSLGPFGGDGKVNVGTLTPADILFDTSLARNLNNTGYFAGGVQVVGNAVANLLVDSPPTLNTTDSYVLTPAAAAVFTAPNPDSADSPGWNFHDTYFVTIKAAKLASLGFNLATWKVEPNADELHNSPAKPCPAGGGGPCNLTITKKEVKDRQVKITIKNNGSQDEFISAVNLTWPSATNGTLKKVKRDGDVIYDTPDIAGGTANLTAAQLVADPNKRKITKGQTDVLTFEFEKNADTNLAHYTGTVSFGPNCLLTILP
jgi:hypothetical protein